MDWSSYVASAAMCTVLGASAGTLVPRLIARLPEPELETSPAGSSQSSRASQPPKPLYVDLAAAPRLAAKSAAWGGLTGGLIGISTGWTWALLFLLPLVPLGVALGHVDFRTRLLPTRLIRPGYAVTIVGILLATAITRDLDALRWAVIGWAIVGAVFWLLWLLTRGMGYGDVRLSGVLGLALGYLGWGELLLGTYSGFVLGAVGWIPLRLLGISKDRKVPFGPFMLLGAVVGILWGDDLAAFLSR